MPTEPANRLLNSFQSSPSRASTWATSSHEFVVGDSCSSMPGSNPGEGDKCPVVSEVFRFGFSVRLLLPPARLCALLTSAPPLISMARMFLSFPSNSSWTRISGSPLKAIMTFRFEGVLNRDPGTVLADYEFLDDFDNGEKDVRRCPFAYGIVVTAIELRAKGQERQFRNVASRHSRRESDAPVRQILGHDGAETLEVGRFLG